MRQLVAYQSDFTINFFLLLIADSIAAFLADYIVRTDFRLFAYIARM
jgi:hypothetical protein